MIGNRKLMGIIENETLAALSCDQKSHTDGESEMRRSDLPHVIRSLILTVKVKKETLCYKLEA